MSEIMMEQPAPVQTQISQLLEEIAQLDLKISDTKYTLKQYKIKSPRLDQLKKAKKELSEQIRDEKERIEDEYLEDKEYEGARNDKLTLGNERKEKIGILRTTIKKHHNIQPVYSEDVLVEGQQTKLQLEFYPELYCNGKKL